MVIHEYTPNFPVDLNLGMKAPQVIAIYSHYFFKTLFPPLGYQRLNSAPLTVITSKCAVSASDYLSYNLNVTNSGYSLSYLGGWGERNRSVTNFYFSSSTHSYLEF